MEFKIGDLIRYKSSIVSFSKYRGKVIEVIQRTNSKHGYYTIEYIEDGLKKKFVDYDYVFELDIQAIRSKKLEKILENENW
jgi:hypothetical protein